MSKYEFQGKYIIKFDLRCLTGLSIGGTAEGLEIGGVDNPVIKDPLTGYPYIPGSSLKGKLRSLLEWAHNEININDKGEALPHSCEHKPQIQELREKRKNAKSEQEKEEINKQIKQELSKLIDKCPICRIFGISASAEVGEPTRIAIRDAYPKRVYKKKANGEFEKDEKGNRIPDPEKDTIARWENWLGEGLYTELKVENAIDRITSQANPRTMERVPKDSVFEVEIIYDIYKQDDVQYLKYLFQAMSLLEDSYLGGSGSRGSGKIKFENPKIIYRDKKEYYLQKNGTERVIKIDEVLKNIKEEDSIPKVLFDNFDNIDWKGEK